MRKILFTFLLFSVVLSLPLCAAEDKGWKINHTTVTIYSDNGFSEWFEWSASYYDYITTVVIEGNVTSVPDNAFSGYGKITYVRVNPDASCVIGKNAFSDCFSVTKAVFGENVTEIGENAFSGCDSIAEVTYYGSPDGWEDIKILSGNDIILSATLTCEKENTGLGKNAWIYIVIGVGVLIGAAITVLIVLEHKDSKKKEKFYYRVWQYKD